jgi:hypothetical protein
MTAAAKTVAARTTTGQIRGLRISALASLLMLLIEYGLGVWTNLYAQLPSSDHGKATLAAFGGAVAHGPAGLALHALLGTLLIVNAVLVVVRATLVRQTASVILGAITLIAVLAAWFSGTKFVSDQANSASFGMAVAAGAAILGNAIILFIAVPIHDRGQRVSGG